MRTLIAVAVLLLALANCATAAAQEVIDHFNSRVAVTRDGQLDVVETIEMNFGDDERHGIFRIIPVKYETKSGVRETAFHIEKISMDDHPIAYQAARQFNDINIKIGDPERKVTGKHTYAIHYLVSRAVNFFDNQPEIYWNATGDQWPFPIREATAQFILPSGADASKVSFKSFRGARGSTEAAIATVSSNEIDFAASNLAPAEGLTFVLRLPEGSITVSGNINEILWWLSEWWPLVVLPLVTLVGAVINWNLHGKDPENAQIAGVEWNPPKQLSPAEVGTLIDERCDVADIVSTLVDLAVRGYLRIEQHKNSGFLFSNFDYIFTKLDPPPNQTPLKAHEQSFLNDLFADGSPVTLSSLKYRFYSYIPQLKNQIYSALTSNGYFVSNPETCRFSYMALGCVCSLIGLVILARQHPAAGYGVMLSGVIIMGTSPFMPRRTKKGVDACRQSVGFRCFVQKAEKERIRVLAKDDPTVFGRLLPYAMVLGAADRWAEAFHDLLTQPPDWYVPYNYGSPNFVFSPTTFVNDLGDGMRTCAATFAAVPQSSPSSGSSGAAGGFSGFSDGGGFSGGGFGGGGGGSW